jgi:hypothetical protein
MPMVLKAVRSSSIFSSSSIPERASVTVVFHSSGVTVVLQWYYSGVTVVL